MTKTLKPSNKTPSPPPPPHNLYPPVQLSMNLSRSHSPPPPFLHVPLPHPLPSLPPRPPLYTQPPVTCFHQHNERSGSTETGQRVGDRAGTGVLVMRLWHLSHVNTRFLWWWCCRRRHRRRRFLFCFVLGFFSVCFLFCFLGWWCFCFGWLVGWLRGCFCVFVYFLCLLEGFPPQITISY